MRIHSLEIQAFGPFAGKETVDFDALGAHGLFLLNGPTGAGKTSILDAVCYAFYGSVPGARQEGRRLRSDHAQIGTAPEVVCEFSARGKRFRVVRSPQWSRPSKRGSGTTTEQAHTLLSEWVDGVWVEKSARNDEAAAEITAILGMNREQFTRVVMLPQGDFAAFLRSDAKARRDLLQQLFNTDRFEAIEQQLGDEAVRARSAWEEREAELHSIHERALDVLQAHTGPETESPTSDESQPPVPEEINGEDVQPSAREIVEQLTARSESVALTAEQLRVELESARTAAAQAQSTRDQRDALTEYRRRRRALEASQDQAEEVSAALQLHRTAEALSSAVRRVDEAAKVAKSRRSEALAQQEQLRQHPFWLAGPGQTEPVSEENLTRESRAAGHLLGAIGAALPEESKLQGLVREQQLLEQSVQESERRLPAVLAELENARASKGELADRSGALAPVANSLDRAEQAVKEARQRQDAVTEYSARSALAAQIRKNHLDAKETALDKKSMCLELMRRRLEQAATELASRLTEGEACPVCGSEEHPSPSAVDDDGLVSRQDEEQARQEQENAEQKLESIAAHWAQIREEISALAARGGDQPAEAVRQALESAEESAAAARRAAVELEDVQRSMEALDQKIQEQGEQYSDMLNAVSEAQLRLTHLDGSITELENRLQELRDGHESLEERKRAVTLYRDQLDGVREAARVARTSQEAARDAEEHLAVERERAGFSSVDAVRRARLEPSRVEQLEAHESARLRDLVEVEALQDSPLVQAARTDEEQGVPVPDDAGLVELRAHAQRVEELHTEARVQSRILAEAVLQVSAYAQKYEQLERDAEPLRERWNLVGQLAETARGSGDNTYRMTLGTYVLAARLEQIAMAATERLSAMTDGRYALVHSDAKSGNRKSGLSLHVTDGWTGQSRDTSTLSGGESFMASLALALGLADVVQQESGGVEMETLFVDEGFGSLDEQSLEQVMDALEGLRDGGRIVGLVSHVAEMKQRIPAQLEVIKERTGSRIRFRELSL